MEAGEGKLYNIYNIYNVKYNKWSNSGNNISALSSHPLIITSILGRQRRASKNTRYFYQVSDRPDWTSLCFAFSCESNSRNTRVSESVSESHFSISSMMLYHFISVCVSTSKCSPRISIETMKNQSSATIVYSGLVNPTDLLCLWVLYIKDNNS